MPGRKPDDDARLKFHRGVVVVEAAIAWREAAEDGDAPGEVIALAALARAVAAYVKVRDRGGPAPPNPDRKGGLAEFLGGVAKDGGNRRSRRRPPRKE